MIIRELKKYFLASILQCCTRNFFGWPRVTCSPQGVNLRSKTIKTVNNFKTCYQVTLQCGVSLTALLISMVCMTTGSVNEYQLWLGRQRQVWFIPLADVHGVCRRTCAIPERLRGVFTTRHYTNPRLPLPLPVCVPVQAFAVDCCLWPLLQTKVHATQAVKCRSSFMSANK